jgi:hypothetical protein
MKERFFLARHFIIVLILSPILLIWVNQAQFTQQPLFNATRYQFTPPFFKLVTFGFWPAAVDGLWIETVQLLASQNINSVPVAEVASFYDLATDLDPNFYELYEQAGVGFGIMGDDYDLGIHFFQKGIDVFQTKNPPRAFWTHPVTLYIFKAYIEAFQKNDWAQAKQTYLAAGALPNAPVYLQQMKIWLAEKNSERQLAKKVLTSMIRLTEDVRVQEKLKEKLAHYE